MTIDQSLTPVVLDGGEVSLRLAFLPVEEIREALGAELDDHDDDVRGPLMPQPMAPVWPRVYPGL